MPPEASETMAQRGKGDAWCPRLGASSCERPILRDGCPLAGASSFERPNMRAGCSRLGASSFERPSAANPDLFPMVGEDPEADFSESHWPSGTDGDCALNKREELSSTKCSSENTDNPHSPQETVPPPLKRLRKKTTPHTKHITHNNNITIAHATSLATTTITKIATTHQKALVTRCDLVATSKYYKYHKSLGHTPQHIQQVAGRQKKRLLAESGLPTQIHKKIFLVHDKSIMSKKQKIKHNKHITALMHSCK